MIRFDVADRMMLYSLDCLVLCYQEQRTRGFAAHEAMRGVTFSLRKKFIRVSPPIASPDLSSGRRLPAVVFTCLWKAGGKEVWWDISTAPAAVAVTFLAKKVTKTAFGGFKVAFAQSHSHSWKPRACPD